MEAFTDPAVRELWVMKSAQVGWTTILENFVGYHVHQDPAPILLVQPTLEIAEAFSKDRLAPMIRDTPALRGKIADAKSRDSGNTLLHKKFTGGHLTLAGANSPSGLASRPIRVVLLDEIDRYPASAGTEGNPINLSIKRSTAFWNKRIAGGSTPTIKGASQIENRFESSDQRYYFVPCGHCGEFQRLVWAQVQWDDGKPQTARYLCKACGTLWTDAERMDSIARGEWRSQKPFNGVAGFHVNEVMSPFVRLEDMARNFLEAKKLPETLQTFVNTSLAETWEETGEKVEPEGLLARLEPYDVENIPEDVLLLTVGGDTQSDRVELQLLGWGLDEECWVIEQKVVRGDPGTPALWAEVDEYIKAKRRTVDGRQLFVEAAGIDSGGHFTQQVYQYCAARKRFRIWAVKGMAGAGKLAWPKRPTKVKKNVRADVFLVGVDTIKSLFYQRLKLTERAGGYIHLPTGTDAEFCRQFTSETAVSKFIQGRRVIVWKPRAVGIAQEAQDCWLYGYGAMIGRGGCALLARRAGIRERRKTEDVPPTDQAALQTTAAPAPVQTSALRLKPKPGGKRGWVKNWRW